MHVIAEELQRLLGRHQRLVRVLQPLEQLLLRKAVLLAHQDPEHALTQLRVRVIRDLAQGRDVVAAARLERDDAEARRLKRLQRRKPHLHGLVLVAQDLQHRLQVLVALTHRQWRFRHGRDPFLDGPFCELVAIDIARSADLFAAAFAFFGGFERFFAALRFVAMSCYLLAQGTLERTSS